MTRANLGTIAVLCWSVTHSTQSPTGLKGVITSVGDPIPGAAVTIEGIDFHDASVADEQGRYQFATVPPGAYTLSVALPGFRTVTRRLMLIEGGAATVNIELEVGRLQEVHYALPDALGAFRMAAAVAHLRIDRTVEPANCGDNIVAFHLAAVISVVKGHLPPSIWVSQEHTGSCFDLGQLVNAGTPYQAGEEYIAFLRAEEGSFSSLAGRGTFVRVKNGQVVDGYPPIREGMTVEEVWAALSKGRF